VIGTSTNLIVDGLMVKYKLGSMPFFELAKINLPFTPIMLLYLVFMPRFLLPKAKGGLLRLATSAETRFVSQMIVQPVSPLIGQAMTNLSQRIPESFSDVAVVHRCRQDSTALIDDREPVAAGDVIMLRGRPDMLRDIASLLGMAWGQALPRSSRATAEARLESGQMSEAESLETGIVDPLEVEPLSKEGQSEQRTHVEVVLSAKCANLGTTIGSELFQRSYSVCVLAVRSTLTATDVTGADLLDHVLVHGDVLLLLVNSDFREKNLHCGAFIVINQIGGETQQTVDRHYLRIPVWIPFGSPAPVGAGDGKPCRIVLIPWWYKSLSLPIFAALLGCAIAGYDLSTCALIASVALVTLGIHTLDRALAAIDVEIFVMVAFSFGIGSAMNNSGFAAVIGQALQDLNVSGLQLLYVIAVASAFMTNVITNKACVQVLVPLIVSAYRIQKIDPLPAVMMCCATASMALATPYGFATNLMVMGPGGYRASDFLKFGLPLNLLAIIFLPLITYAVYPQLH
jgi:di/tricarboxylate transporter